MTWLQENWMIAVVGLVVAVALLWWLFGRARPAEVAPPTIEPAKPAKPLEPAKPDIIAAEPARFKPIEPKPAPVAPAPPPAPGPAATPPPAPVAEAPTKPAAKPKPAAKKTATKAPAAKATVKKAAAKPPADAAAIPAEPTVPPPPAPAPTVAKADNLQLLKGVGPKLVVLLNGLGVTRFQQIAEWTDADIARIDAQLGAFQGRIARDNLVDQASYLARGDKAGFEAKYGALGGEL
ncbi:hypothetical protein [Sphingopyxis sp. FD7]|jgi:predicted flap endonuclease-1-like 5' DNA nuclease|uniref:hypothetical protein n=1 Tax=Sphingopyxis sp. FD7 TaxID=1914525 RepID=UPI000DC63A93|nr:hypothetical protein [Sphingopyxis sp. FD7]BBB13285.1 hypothetical protein SPYCA_2543 [Sphingopyxis sp. FD7]